MKFHIEDISVEPLVTDKMIDRYNEFAREFNRNMMVRDALKMSNALDQFSVHPLSLRRRHELDSSEFQATYTFEPHLAPLSYRASSYYYRPSSQSSVDYLMYKEIRNIYFQEAHGTIYLFGYIC
ncbi:hypothetical protein RF11_07783 [Thelohanellus kitauei]|uniref:Uncharacterized protein n=1 Tax=Thelohanellus kitauei TaxID=669202 RepID=A0A0C2MLZ2_THEKT|nr:hypothetical protein RF11_07783 [Thelohanellus kitauei]